MEDLACGGMLQATKTKTRSVIGTVQYVFVIAYTAADEQYWLDSEWRLVYRYDAARCQKIRQHDRCVQSGRTSETDSRVPLRFQAFYRLWVHRCDRFRRALCADDWHRQVTNCLTGKGDVLLQSCYLSQQCYAYIGVCLFVCVFVSKVKQKLFDRFSQNSVERWTMGQGRNC